jgi:hypothetical protein
MVSRSYKRGEISDLSGSPIISPNGKPILPDTAQWPLETPPE